MIYIYPSVVYGGGTFQNYSSFTICFMFYGNPPGKMQKIQSRNPISLLALMGRNEVVSQGVERVAGGSQVLARGMETNFYVMLSPAQLASRKLPAKK